MNIGMSVLGIPKPQGSKKAFTARNGRIVLVEQAGKPLKEWRETITAMARATRISNNWPVYHEGPMAVELTFHMKQPHRPANFLPITRPDIDKLCRAVLDSLTDAHIWKDDSQVVHLLARKTYGNPGVDIRLWTL